jgi:dethiobiotin synthetase
MPRRLLIAGTGPRVGKTTVGCALGFAMRARGMRVGVMKPVDMECVEIGGALESRDAQSLALAVGSLLPMDLICPYRYSAANFDRALPPDLAHIARCFNQIAANNDVVLVESADSTDFADLAATLGLEVIVVVGNRSDCATATILTLRRCASRGLKIAGYILCDCDQLPASELEANDALLNRVATIPCLGRMRHREPLARTIVEQLILPVQA